jgi:hypothetical protein
LKACYVALAAAWSFGVAASAQEHNVSEPANRPRIVVTLNAIAPHFRPDADYTGGYASRSNQRALKRAAEKLAGEYGLTVESTWPIPALGVDCFVLEIPSGVSSAQILERLARDPRVESTQPMNVFRVLGYNDPLYRLQRDAESWPLDDIHKFVTGRGVRVAVIDTGIETEHPDLRGQIADTKNFVDESEYVAEAHGTAVAGIIAARANNGVGIAGIAPRSRLLALRACWQDGLDSVCNSFTLAKALQFALDGGAQVINLSLGGPRDPLLERLIDTALAKGVTVVGAQGASPDNNFPASHPGVLAVASNTVGEIRGSVLITRGDDIPSTSPGGRWNFVSGSSFAAAKVTGIVALLHELNPRLSPRQVRNALHPAEVLSAANKLPATIDLCSAITRTAGACVCDCVAKHANDFLVTP